MLIARLNQGAVRHWIASLFGRSDSAVIWTFSRNHARISSTVDRHNGTARCFRPLPCKCTKAAPSSTTSATRIPVSYTHLRAHETRHDLVCRLLLEKKKQQIQNTT